MPFRSNCRRARQTRAGLTTVEVLLSLLLLSVAAVGVGRYSALMRQGLQTLDLSSRIRWELVNARETIFCWDPEQIQVDAIASLPISAGVLEQLPDARWEVEVVEIKQPLVARQIQLALVGTYAGQEARPQALTFWIPEQ